MGIRIRVQVERFNDDSPTEVATAERVYGNGDFDVAMATRDIAAHAVAILYTQPVIPF